MLQWAETQKISAFSAQPDGLSDKSMIFSMFMIVLVSLTEIKRIKNQNTKASIFPHFSFQMRSAADMASPTSRAEIQAYAENLDTIFDALACPTFT